MPTKRPLSPRDKEHVFVMFTPGMSHADEERGWELVGLLTDGRQFGRRTADEPRPVERERRPGD